MRKESIVLLFLFGCHIGHALKCYTCSGDCTDMTTAECTPNQQCIAKEKRTDGKIQLQEKSCVDATECNVTSPDKSLTQTCCNTDLCNGAATTTSPTSTSTSAKASSTVAGGGAAGGGGNGTGEHDTLICYKCTDFTCAFKTAARCKHGESCVTKYTKIFGMDMKQFDCANSTVCSKQTSEPIIGTSTSIKNKCCDTDLCNLAITLKVPSIPIILSVLFLMIIKLY